MEPISRADKDLTVEGSITIGRSYIDVVRDLCIRNMVLTGRFIIQDEFPLLLAETPHLQLMWRRTWNDMWLNVRTLSYRKEL